MKYREDKAEKVNYSNKEIGCVKDYREEQVKMSPSHGEKYSSNNVEAYRKELAKKVK